MDVVTLDRAEPVHDRRWIQTPSAVTVVYRSTGGRVVLGASPRAAIPAVVPLIYLSLP